MYPIGWCRGIEDAALLRQFGCDYIECALTDLELEKGKEYLNLLPAYLDSPVPVRAFNLFFPGDMKIVGPAVDEKRIYSYVENAADALNRIGAKIAVLGSGGARRIPEGFDRQRSEEQFLKLLERIADAFQETGTTLAIEPLNRKSANFIHSVEEGCCFAKQINRDAIRVLADFYHMEEEQEALETIDAHKEWLAHIHIADTGRLSPGSGQYPYDEFARQLRLAGYEGMISAECIIKDPFEIKESMGFIKSKFS